AMGSPASTDKYPASSSNENYPEVATRLNQRPLQTSYSQPSYPQNSYPLPSQEAFTPQTTYQYQVPPKQDVYEPQEKQKRNPWGLSPLAFGLLVAIITALVVGGAVGGGVAGAMSGKDDSRAHSSNVTVSTTTVTAGDAVATPTASASGTATSSALPEPSSLKSFTVPEPYYVGTLADPGCQQSRIDVQNDERYDLSCGVDMGNNIKDRDDSTKVVADIVGIFAYSITDCLYACTNVNRFTETWKTGTAQQCKGVTWTYNMAQSNTSNSANCWLKNGTSTGYQCNSCISGVL
ncbi:uncharacterized protein A1O9_09464, partial [Exophiala aquamarina CBS 119918]